MPDAVVRTLHDIPGWFPPTDQVLFDHFLSPDAVARRGHLVELGVYLGKSAVLIGSHVAADETFTVCDLFGAESDDEANQRENAKSYSTLDRESFELNYLALHDSLPIVIQGLSSEIVEHVAPASVRFMHVDASHLYDHVVTDLESAAKLLLPDGVVVFDDYRSNHTPGVAAAVWEAVSTRGLRPICLTEQKMYATFGDPAPHQAALRRWLVATPDMWWTEERIAGAPVFRVSRKRPPAASKPSEIELLKQEVAQLAGRLDAATTRIGRVEAGLHATITSRARRVKYALRSH